MAEKIRLSTFWDDPESWAGGKPGTVHKPGDTVTLENPAHADLLRQAGYEALDAKPADAKADSSK